MTTGRRCSPHTVVAMATVAVACEVRVDRHESSRWLRVQKVASDGDARREHGQVVNHWQRETRKHVRERWVEKKAVREHGERQRRGAGAVGVVVAPDAPSSPVVLPCLNLSAVQLLPGEPVCHPLKSGRRSLSRSHLSAGPLLVSLLNGALVTGLMTGVDQARTPHRAYSDAVRGFEPVSFLSSLRSSW